MWVIFLEIHQFLSLLFLLQTKNNDSPLINVKETIGCGFECQLLPYTISKNSMP